MIRKAFVMRVNPDQHDEYRKRHNPIWPELEATLKSSGVHNYSIFLNPETNQLFAYVEIEDESPSNPPKPPVSCHPELAEGSRTA